MEEGRRRGMLTHQASVIKNPPPNRNLGREVRDDYSDDDDDDGASASRTLFDIIQDEESSAAFAYSGVFAPAGGGRGGGGANKLNWKSFTDRLRIRRTGHAWNSSSQSVPVSDDFRDPSSPRPAVSRTRSSARNGSRIGGSAMDLGSSQRPEAEEEEEEEEEEAEEREKEPGMVSLMSLLRREEDDGEEEEEEEERGEEEEEEEDVEENEEELVCCVCMVRHKGAAFIPCGHTFCRMCSRELWASTGNCPLCNGYILEILNIF